MSDNNRKWPVAKKKVILTFSGELSADIHDKIRILMRDAIVQTNPQNIQIMCMAYMYISVHLKPH